MIVGIVTAVLGLLFIGFLVLTSAEAKSGRRVFAQSRARLDTQVEDARVALHVLDLEHTLLRKAIAGGSLIAHEVAHGLLIGIRALERLLTRTTKHLREKAQTE